jgi:hypothetical protein
MAAPNALMACSGSACIICAASSVKVSGSIIICLTVASAHDLHFLEEQGGALAKHVLALREFLLEVNWPDLAAGERDVLDLLRHPDPAGQTAALGDREMARDALNLRIIDALRSRACRWE